MLTAAGDDIETLIPVAIETLARSACFCVASTGRLVHAINRLAVARYRERHPVARAKSDHADAMTLANILRVDAHLHRQLPAEGELCPAIAMLARAHQDTIWARTKAHHQLRSLLREVYPRFLGVFADRFALGIASSQARAVLAIAPTPTAAAELSVSRIAERYVVPGAAAASPKQPLRSKTVYAKPNCINHFRLRQGPGPFDR